MRALLKTFTRVAALTAGMTMAVGLTTAAAAPIAAVDYLETELGGGLFRYDYALLNLGDPLADAGFDAYDLALFFSPLVTLVSSATPSGWDLIAGAGFVDTFSLFPGVSPFGADVGPGQSLAGFSFVFDSQLGSIPFQVVFANPNDAASPLVFDGQTGSFPESPAPVPEPGTLALVATGALMAYVKRRRAGVRNSTNGPTA